MNAAEAEGIVEDSLAQLKREQPELFTLEVSERAITHQLAICIAARVGPGLSVDTEYNRHFKEPKRLNLPPRRALDRETRATTALPDIIVHVRDTDASNLMVLELKRLGEAKDYDALKLRAFKYELGYRHAAHVTVGATRAGEPFSEVEWLVG
ncbi:MAG: hypothetical protein AB7G12_13810 [Thermoanaerobaculia bacterium]